VADRTSAALGFFVIAKALKSDDLIRVSDESAAMPKSMPKIVEGEAGELQVGGRAPAGTTLFLLTLLGNWKRN